MRWNTVLLFNFTLHSTMLYSFKVVEKLFLTLPLFDKYFDLLHFTCDITCDFTRDFTCDFKCDFTCDFTCGF